MDGWAELCCWFTLLSTQATQMGKLPGAGGYGCACESACVASVHTHRDACVVHVLTSLQLFDT